MAETFAEAAMRHLNQGDAVDPKERVKISSAEKVIYAVDPEIGVVVMTQDYKSKAYKTKGILEIPKFIQAIASQRPITTPFLEPGTFVYSTIKDVTIIGHQFPPFMLDLVYSGPFDSPQDAAMFNQPERSYRDGVRFTRNYRVMMPWSQFYIVLGHNGTKTFVKGGAVTCSINPLKSLTDTVYRIPTPNRDGSEIICWGSNPVEIQSGENVTSFAKRVANTYFITPFNRDHSFSPTNLFANFYDWHHKTIALGEGLLKDLVPARTSNNPQRIIKMLEECYAPA